MIPAAQEGSRVLATTPDPGHAAPVRLLYVSVCSGLLFGQHASARHVTIAVKVYRCVSLAVVVPIQRFDTGQHGAEAPCEPGNEVQAGVAPCVWRRL